MTKGRELQTKKNTGAEAEPKQSEERDEEKKENKPGSWIEKKKNRATGVSRRWHRHRASLGKEEERRSHAVTCLEKPKAFLGAGRPPLAVS